MTLRFNCGLKRTLLLGDVPSFEQFSVQHRRAAEALVF